MSFRYCLLALATLLLAVGCGKTPDGPDQPNTDKVIAVESLLLSDASIIMPVGSSLTLTATVHPENATDQTVIWWSSDATIVSVKGGQITALTKGSAIIHAYAFSDENKAAVCNVEVRTSSNDPYKEGGEGRWE